MKLEVRIKNENMSWCILINSLRILLFSLPQAYKVGVYVYQTPVFFIEVDSQFLSARHPVQLIFLLYSLTFSFRVSLFTTIDLIFRVGCYRFQCQIG